MTDVFQTPSSCAEPRPCPCVSLASETGCIDLGIGRSVHLDEEVHQFCCTDGGCRQKLLACTTKTTQLASQQTSLSGGGRNMFIGWTDGHTGPYVHRTKFCVHQTREVGIGSVLPAYLPLAADLYVCTRAYHVSQFDEALLVVWPHDSIRQVPFCTASAQTQDVF
jgi:hypothetical protein